MNELKAKTVNGKEVIDSRDVAVMVSRSHKELLRTIHQYIEYMEEGAERNLALGENANINPADFFIENTYFDKNGQERPNYLITRMGCEMIANKMTGKKGVLFTAAYVSAFNAMRGALASATTYEKPTMAEVRDMELKAKYMDKMGCTPFEVSAMLARTSKAYNLYVAPEFTSKVDPQLSLFSPTSPALPA